MNVRRDSIQGRLTALIAEFVDRIAALKAEQVACEEELTDARRALDAMRVASLPTVVEPSIVETPKAKKERPIVRMPEAAVIAFLEQEGPKSKADVLQRFGFTDGRAGAIFNVWMKKGSIQRRDDGLYEAPEQRTAKLLTRVG